ncbi:MAG: GTP pyrophosphokinase [Magnetococcales bacterium]|nr:GTP pyrophosphokinase [Magnetococcales bacterium]
MATLERALYLAVTAHLGQVDKAGAPYILHPLRLMLRAGSPEARMVALLHDTVEDTSLTLEDLRQEGFAEPILTAVERLTHRPEESYESYIQRLSSDPLAVQVKLLDLEDNMDRSRLGPTPGERDEQRLAKYKKYWGILQTVAHPGADA